MSSDRKATSKQTYYQQHLIWKENIVLQQVKYFNEELGDNTRDTCETFVDLFHCLFAKDIIHPLMYQNNLYPTQKQGGGLHFQPPNCKEIQ
jgi:hypothetical protein